MQYLISYLMEVGPTGVGGMGPAPLTHQELLAWQMNMRRLLQPWEISMLWRLSREWCAESHRAEDPDALAPWTAPEASSENLVRVGDSLRSAIRAMAGKK